MDISNQREILLAAHLAFDFSREHWLELKSGDKTELGLFREKRFGSWRHWQGRRIQSFAEAQKVSGQIPFQRITFLDEDFPEALRELASGPPVIYLRGKAKIPPVISLISIVGTRRPSNFGVSVAQETAQYFCDSGLGVVSGLAKGVDAESHLTALRNKSPSSNYTIAILGSGLDRLYPKENAALAEHIIAAGGTILSQFPPGTIPHPSHFPRRNRLIAALSAGTLVVEGSPASGALITGRAALELGRTTIVFTQDFRSDFGKGAIELISLGAYPALGYDDAKRAISQTFGGWLAPMHSAKKGILPIQKSDREFSVFDFQNRCGLTVREAIVALEKLRRTGKVTPSGQGNFFWAEDL